MPTRSARTGAVYVVRGVRSAILVRETSTDVSWRLVCSVWFVVDRERMWSRERTWSRERMWSRKRMQSRDVTWSRKRSWSS